MIHCQKFKRSPFSKKKCDFVYRASGFRVDLYAYYFFFFPSTVHYFQLPFWVVNFSLVSLPHHIIHSFFFLLESKVLKLLHSMMWWLATAAASQFAYRCCHFCYIECGSIENCGQSMPYQIKSTRLLSCILLFFLRSIRYIMS